MASDSPRRASFAADVVNTAWTSIVTMVALVLVTRWMAAALSSDEFGVYGLSRRLASAAAIYSNVVGLTLARYVAMEDDEERRDAFLLAGLLCTVLPAVVLIGATSILPGPIAVVAFHEATLGGVTIATAVLVLGTAMFNLAYAHFRGVGRVNIGNYWQVGVVAVIPIFVAYRFAAPGRIPIVNGLTGAGMALALFPLIGRMVRAALRPSIRSQVVARIGDFVRYGLPRVPGGFAFGALIAVGPYLAPRFGGMQQAGYLVAGQSLLRIVEAGTAAFGVVALPKVAGLLARGQVDFVRDRVEDVIGMAVHLGLLASALLLIWSDVVVLAWLGPRYAAAVPIVRITMLAAVPYLAYTILRSVVDALEERAVNTRNVLVALGATIVMSILAGLLGFGGQGLAAAGALGLVVLGCLTVHFVWVTLAPVGGSLALGRGAFACLIALVPCFVARSFATQVGDVWMRLLLAGGASFLSTALYVALLTRWQVRWLREVRTRMARMVRHG